MINPFRKGFLVAPALLFFGASSTLLCITLLFSLFFLLSSDQAVAQTGDSSPMVLIDSYHQTISPVSGNLEDMIALIEELIRILEEMKRKIEVGPDGKNILRIENPPYRGVEFSPNAASDAVFITGYEQCGGFSITIPHSPEE